MSQDDATLTGPANSWHNVKSCQYHHLSTGFVMLCTTNAGIAEKVAIATVCLRMSPVFIDINQSLTAANRVKSSHLYLYSAFNNTDCVKALNSISV